VIEQGFRPPPEPSAACGARRLRARFAARGVAAVLDEAMAAAGAPLAGPARQVLPPSRVVSSPPGL
jgi:hypothetical protein